MSFEDLELGRPFASNARHHHHLPQDSSQAIAAAVFRINTGVAAFHRLVNSLGTPKDTLLLRQNLHKTRLHIGQLVKDTSTKLKQTSETDQHAEVSTSKKIADAKLAKDFQSVLREFQKAQRLAADREKAYVPFVPKEVLTASNTGSELEATDSSESPEQIVLDTESKRQEVVLLENEIIFNEAIIEEREQGIKEIQQQISEVNDIFKDLAVLVHEQGVMIDDISTNIERSHAGTAQATSQLEKASKIQRSNSSMKCLLLVIFGIILLIVVILVVA